MFHIFANGQRITDHPVSYNHIISHLFQFAKIEWNKLSELPYDEAYSYEEYIFVRAV